MMMPVFTEGTMMDCREELLGDAPLAWLLYYRTAQGMVLIKAKVIKEEDLVSSPSPRPYQSGQLVF